MSSLVRVLATILLPVAFSQIAIGVLAAAPEALSLRIEANRAEFLPGESVIVSMSVENRGPAAFEDLAWFEPRLGFLGFSLNRNGEEVRWTGPRETWLFSRPGMTLRGGERVCDTFDLLDYFGVPEATVAGTDTISWDEALPPGQYELSMRCQPRLRPNSARPPSMLSSNTVHFTVRGPASIPASEARFLRALKLRRAERSGLTLIDASRSRYVVALARRILLERGPEDTEAVDTALLTQIAREAGALTAAAVLRAKYESFHSRLTACQAWVSGLVDEAEASSMACHRRMINELVMARVAEKQDGD
jgi:hypothetical protein